MAALGAAAVTVNSSTRTIGPRGVRRQQASIKFGDGVSTYPAGGIPLPTTPNLANAMGFSRAFQRLYLIDESNGDGVMYKFDSVNNKIRLYWPTQQTAGAGNRAALEFQAADVPANNTTLQAMLEGL